MRPTTPGEAERLLHVLRSTPRDMLGFVTDADSRMSVVTAARCRFTATRSTQHLRQWIASLSAALYAGTPADAFEADIMLLRSTKGSPEAHLFAEVFENLVASGARIGGPLVIAGIRRVGGEERRRAHAKAIEQVARSRSRKAVPDASTEPPLTASVSVQLRHVTWIASGE